MPADMRYIKTFSSNQAISTRCALTPQQECPPRWKDPTHRIRLDRDLTPKSTQGEPQHAGTLGRLYQIASQTLAYIFDSPGAIQSKRFILSMKAMVAFNNDSIRRNSQLRNSK